MFIHYAAPNTKTAKDCVRVITAWCGIYVSTVKTVCHHSIVWCPCVYYEDCMYVIVVCCLSTITLCIAMVQCLCICYEICVCVLIAWYIVCVCHQSVLSVYYYFMHSNVAVSVSAMKSGFLSSYCHSMVRCLCVCVCHQSVVSVHYYFMQSNVAVSVFLL